MMNPSEWPSLLAGKESPHVGTTGANTSMMTDTVPMLKKETMTTKTQGQTQGHIPLSEGKKQANAEREQKPMYPIFQCRLLIGNKQKTPSVALEPVLESSMTMAPVLALANLPAQGMDIGKVGVGWKDSLLREDSSKLKNNWASESKNSMTMGPSPAPAPATVLAQVEEEEKTKARALGKAEGMALGKTEETPGWEQIAAARSLPRKRPGT
jgi:hypothetical protein